MSRARRRRPKKEFLTTWAFEVLDRDPTFCTRPMFGCLAAYVRSRMVMVLTEDPGDQSYRGKRYDFDLWNGILFPTKRDDHASLLQEFDGLKPHPVLGKWLFLPADYQHFETRVREIGERISQGDPRFGVEPGVKLPKRSRHLLH